LGCVFCVQRNVSKVGWCVRKLVRKREKLEIEL